MVDLKEAEERVILVGVALYDIEEMEHSLEELKELVTTAGAVSLEMFIQSREQIHPGTYLGKGKLDELKERIAELGATGIVCDDELTPAQMRNMEQILDTKVMDRTLIILDIFAQRANTREGKIQVELAQLRYRAARLIGSGTALSRLGGGIGTRGPGESKLESDRRVIHERISVLKRELEDVKRHREVTRSRRTQNRMPVVAIVGYTNAGKSTLLNALTGADILAEDKLFATLDPTTRNLVLPTGEEVLLTDTVGFIRKLPHHLIDAFKSTLEEAKYADIILHVVDSSNPQMDIQMQVVYETLRELEVGDKTVITAFNKSDCPVAQRLSDPYADDTIAISARSGEGLDELQIILANVLRARNIYVENVYDYKDAGKIQLIRRYGQLLKEEYEEDGIHAAGYVPADIIGRL